VKILEVQTRSMAVLLHLHGFGVSNSGHRAWTLIEPSMFPFCVLRALYGRLIGGAGVSKFAIGR
jgi:hypothetical protein